MMADDPKVSNESLILTISVPSLSLSKRMIFLPTETIEEVIEKVTLKLKLPYGTAVAKYGLYLPMKDIWCGELNRTLFSYGLVYLDEIEFRPRGSSRISNTLSESEICQMLGMVDSKEKANLPPCIIEGAGELDILLPKEKKICRFALSYGVTSARLVQQLRLDLAKTIDHIENYGLVMDICDDLGTHRLDYALPLDTEFGSIILSTGKILKLKPIQVMVTVEVATNGDPITTKLPLKSYTDTAKTIKERLMSRFSIDDGNYELTLTFSRDPFKFCGVVLDNRRPIASYPITSNDILYLAPLSYVKARNLDKKLAHLNDKQKIASWNDSWVTFDCPHHDTLGHVTATFLLDNELLLAEAKRLYWSVFPGLTSNEYLIRYTDPSVKKILDDMKRLKTLIINKTLDQSIDLDQSIEDSEPTHDDTSCEERNSLENGKPCEEYNSTFTFYKAKKPSKSTVALRLIPRKSTRTSGRNSSCTGGVYGVPLESLILEEDDGEQVPAHLKTIRAALVMNDAYSTDGIFRQAGAEDEMKSIIEQLNNSTYEPRADCLPNHIYALAGCLKRWVSELPDRILSILLSDEIMTQLESKPSESHNIIYNNLPPTQASLLRWIIKLVARVAKEKEKNRMTAENLAIVFAPIMVDFPADDPMKGIAMNKVLVSILKLLIDTAILGLDKEDEGKEKEAEKEKEKEENLPVGIPPRSPSHSPRRSASPSHSPRSQTTTSPRSTTPPPRSTTPPARKTTPPHSSPKATSSPRSTTPPPSLLLHAGSPTPRAQTTTSLHNPLKHVSEPLNHPAVNGGAPSSSTPTSNLRPTSSSSLRPYSGTRVSSGTPRVQSSPSNSPSRPSPTSPRPNRGTVSSLRLISRTPPVSPSRSNTHSHSLSPSNSLSPSQQPLTPTTSTPISSPPHSEGSS